MLFKLSIIRYISYFKNKMWCFCSHGSCKLTPESLCCFWSPPGTNYYVPDCSCLSYFASPLVSQQCVSAPSEGEFRWWSNPMSNRTRGNGFKLCWERFRLNIRKDSSLKEWCGIAAGSPGSWWNYCHWKCSRKGQMWHWGTWFSGHGEDGSMVRLEDLRGLSNHNDSDPLQKKMRKWRWALFLGWFHSVRLQGHGEDSRCPTDIESRVSKLLEVSALCLSQHRPSFGGSAGMRSHHGMGNGE